MLGQHSKKIETEQENPSKKMKLSVSKDSNAETVFGGLISNDPKPIPAGFGPGWRTRYTVPPFTNVLGELEEQCTSVLDFKIFFSVFCSPSTKFVLRLGVSESS